MLDLHAVVLDDGQSGLLRAFRSVVVADTKLHPDRFHIITIQCFVNDVRNLLARTEDLDDIDVFIHL